MIDLSNSDLVVVKVGTNLLTDTLGDVDRLDVASYQNIGSEISRLSDSGTPIILVSSGAISAGIITEGKERKYVTSLPDVQRYATRGWSIVVNNWKDSIGSSKVSISLLTKQEINNPGTRSKMLSVIKCCLAYGDVFLVNENDCISDEEIRYGDNDILAAEVAVACKQANIFKSVRLVMLTNVNGLNRVADDDSTLIRQVNNIQEVLHFAGGSASEHSRGGMSSKIDSAQLAINSGIEVFIANGRTEGAISKALTGQIGTRFMVEKT